MSDFDRDDYIQKLVDSDIQMIFDLKETCNDEEYIASILQFGFKGYEEFTDDELIVELNQRES